MNRFKFRVWDDSVLRYINWEGIGKNHNLWDILDWDRNHYTPEQYTGLKDSQGKEVYEGDIIISDSDIFVVKWFNSWSCFSCYYISNGEITDDALGMEELRIIKIIGNIHENPELLND